MLQGIVVAQEHELMKIPAGFLVAAFLLAGCAVFAGNIPHADSAGAVNRDAGPVLCRD
ncbi:MAG: hypothetical protein ACRELE_12300 [Gemmatimonadales bacterium]